MISEVSIIIDGLKLDERLTECGFDLESEEIRLVFALNNEQHEIETVSPIDWRAVQREHACPTVIVHHPKDRRREFSSCAVHRLEYRSDGIVDEVEVTLRYLEVFDALTSSEQERCEIAAARLFAGYVDCHDSDDDLRDPIVRALVAYSLGMRGLNTLVQREAWALYLDMIEGL